MTDFVITTEKEGLLTFRDPLEDGPDEEIGDIVDDVIHVRDFVDFMSRTLGFDISWE